MNLMAFVPLMSVFFHHCASLYSSVPNELVHASFSEVLTSCLYSRCAPEVGSKTALAVSILSSFVGRLS